MRCSRLTVGPLAILVALLASSFAPAADQRQSPPPALRRWAVLATNELRETGLADLLTVKLSQDDFDLVERKQLAAITKEFELSKLLGADGAAQRLRVGQLMKADALLLLSLVEYDKMKFVKLVISDCRDSDGDWSAVVHCATTASRLVARTEMFSKVAAYSQASALREAALLLAPNDCEQRAFVLGDYSRQLSDRLYGPRCDVSSPCGPAARFAA
jgi:curli production assembly/transport component CsgG